MLLTRFSALIANQNQVHYVVLIFVVRWRHKFRKIAFKNFQKSKNRRKSFCAPFRI